MNTEQLNRLLYGSKLWAYMLMRRTTYVLTIVAIGLLLYAHGVVTDPKTLQLIYYAIDAILGVFVLIYLLRILYGFERLKFLQRTWFEGMMMALILINHVSTYLFNIPVIYNVFEGLGMPLSVEVYRLLVSLYMLMLLVVELLETRVHLKTLQVKPAVIFLMSFLLLIAIGTAMFMFPKMTNDPDGMRFIDALFMATSASCITGLAVVDPGTYFTFAGQVVLLGLVQLGGLGVMTFATFFATLMRQGIGIKQHVAMFEIMESESISFTKGLLRKLILMTLSIEAIGAMIIFATWSNEVEFVGLGSKIFFSVFHAVSAFCNAGLSLFPEGLYSNPLQNAYVMHLTIAAMVILGGIGFPTMLDVFSPDAMRTRMAMPWRNWKMMTRVTVYTSAALLAFGTVTFFLLEYFNTLSHLNFAEALITSFFQSATTRSSGFHTVDMSAISVPALLIMMMLMFIGASPGSMGGGIKTTTFMVIILSVWTTIVGKRNIEIGKRTIPHSVSYKAFAVFTFAVGFNIIFLIILSISDSQFDILRLAFEQVSAFGTVGLSTGITAGLSDVGKTIIIMSMYIGRVGTLTLALAISTRVPSNAYKYPDTHLSIG
ncbi:potassium transporter TrkG [Pontibacter sp. BT731]|uniref:TrkH family potassium uptake protein n=1 Tax=Pontibacter coccineus TaxID=3063328 RepID=UPI0026E1C3CA|nr:potassium transporter TrkG [Pontibacter sp. BT731]MDO6390292.1 potassium transporter TrkG [Pontibacter sp. BT731]